jgi:mRNA-degrading endonuclease RelE of RelBE toxin-antitoxin system
VGFAVLLHPKAAKELDKIEDQIRSRIKEKLRELRDDPERIGNEINRNKNQAVILFIGHRKKVYDDFSKMF